MIRRKQDDEPPDEKKRNLLPYAMTTALPAAFRPIMEMKKPVSSPEGDEDDFEWPEFIDG